MLLSLLTFTLAATLIVLVPGPDTLVVLRNLVRGGRSAAVRASLGVLTGVLCWVAAAALGLSALLRASEDAYLALRIVGAIYLVWLGVSSLRSRGQPRRTSRPGVAWSARASRPDWPPICSIPRWACSS